MADRADRGGRTVVVRPMAEGDVDAAVAMFAAVAAEGRWMGTEPGFDQEERRVAWRRGLTDPQQQSLVAAAADGTIVGNASFRLAGYGVADLGMAVAAEWRGFVREGLLRRHYRRSSGELWDAVVMGLVLDETSPGSPFDAD